MLCVCVCACVCFSWQTRSRRRFVAASLRRNWDFSVRRSRESVRARKKINNVLSESNSTLANTYTESLMSRLHCLPFSNLSEWGRKFCIKLWFLRICASARSETFSLCHLPLCCLVDFHFCCSFVQSLNGNRAGRRRDCILSNTIHTTRANDEMMLWEARENCVRGMQKVVCYFMRFPWRWNSVMSAW